MSGDERTRDADPLRARDGYIGLPGCDGISSPHAQAEAGQAITVRPEELETWLPMLASVVAYTANAAASISEAGTYAVSFDGEPLPEAEHQVHLRMAADRVGLLVASGPNVDGAPDSLQIVDTDDRLLHRGYLSTERDRLGLHTLTATGAGDWTPAEASASLGPTAPEVASLDLDDAPSLLHLDSIVLDAGATRYGLLLDGAVAATTRIHPAQVLHLLMHLAEESIDLTVGVPTSGLMHMRTGRIDALRSGRHGTSVAMGPSTLSIDPRPLGDGFVTRPIDAPALIEQYDQWGRCAFVICCAAPYGTRESIVWEHLCAMLALSSG